MPDTEKPFEAQSPAYEAMQQKLGDAGMRLLEEQLNAWAELNERELHSPLRASLRSGDTRLPAGTLIHSASMHGLANEAALAGIAEKGIVSGQLVGMAEDSETHGCADFFKVPADTTVADYMKYAGEPVSNGSVNTGRGERMLLRGIAVLVDPKAEGMDDLLGRDGYTDPDMADFIMRPSGRSSSNTAAILGGVPRGALAGIVANQRMLDRPEIAAMLQHYFPDLPVMNHQGELQQ